MRKCILFLKKNFAKRKKYKLQNNIGNQFCMNMKAKSVHYIYMCIMRSYMSTRDQYRANSTGRFIFGNFEGSVLRISRDAQIKIPDQSKSLELKISQTEYKGLNPRSL